MELDGSGDDYAPDKDAPPTTEAEDSVLLEQCEEAIEGEPATPDKPIVQSAVREVTRQI